MAAENTPGNIDRMLRERGARYVTSAEGQPTAVLLSLEEYEHYLDLLDDEADSQDAELATRLTEAASRPKEERLTFQDYLHQRDTGAKVQG
jgi:PHD/YefM family antitoxin component YafN of YafNO toxin-antitoxin module